MNLHQSLSVGNIRLLILSLVATAVVSLLPISSHATVDWNEGFEYANDAALDVVWSVSCLGNPGVSSSRAFRGVKSLRLVYNGKVGIDPGAGGCYIDRNLAGPGQTLYTRYYMYMENFTVDSTATKVTLQGEACCFPSFWWEMQWGAPNLSVAVQGVEVAPGVRGTVNINGSAIPQNQWVCIETRLTMSTPGVDNGIIQTWINGVPGINKTNQRMRSTNPAINSATAMFRFVRLYTQNGRGVIYYDDYAVSRDARIGCGSSTPSSDTTPPIPPSGVLAK